MTAVDQNGQRLATYRLIQRGRLGVEVTVSSEAAMDRDLPLVVAISSSFLASYHREQRGSG
jgi:hypothetical protein